MSYNLDSYDNFVCIAVDSVMNLILCNKLQIHKKVKGRINIAGSKIDDKCGLYDIDDNRNKSKQTKNIKNKNQTNAKLHL